MSEPTDKDRLLSAFRALVRAEFPTLTYAGVFSYAVQSSNGTTVDASPTDSSIPLPDLVGIEIRTGIPGAAVTPSTGTLLAVGFLNSNPALPVVLGAFDSSAASLVKFDTGMGAVEHVATVEGVVNMFINFLYLIQQSGDPSTWTGSGKIFFSSDTTLSVLQGYLNTWLTACGTLSLPTPAAGGGILPVLVAPSIAGTLAAKIPDITGFIPNIGSPNTRTA